MSPPEVTVAKPVQRTVTEYADFTGRTEATESVEIRARVQGFLKSADFTDGSVVEKGAPLFVIEPEPFEAKLAAAQAKKAQTEAKLKLAEANLARAARLVATKAVTKEEFQTKEAMRDAAAAELLADQAAIQQAQIDLSYTKMSAPFRGLTSRRLVDPGNLVGGAQKTLLTTIVQLDPMNVYFDVSERILLKVLRRKQENPDSRRPDEGPKVYLGLADEEGYPHEGTLDFLDNRVDPSTGTAIIRGVFPNKDGVLYRGLFVRVRIPLDPLEGALLVKERALGTDLGGKYLLVVGADNIVQQNPVELGGLIDGMRVIRKGLTAEERYVTVGLQRARPGLPVNPQMEEEPGEQPQPKSGERPAVEKTGERPA